MSLQPQVQFGNNYFNIKRVQSPTHHPRCGKRENYPTTTVHPHPDTDPEDYEEQEEDEEENHSACQPPPLKTISPASFNLRAYLKGAVLGPLMNHCARRHLCYTMPGRNRSASGARIKYVPSCAVEGVEAIRRFTKKSFRDCIEFCMGKDHANGTVQPNKFPRFRMDIGTCGDTFGSCALTLPALVNDYIIPPEDPAPLHPCSCDITTWLQSGPFKTTERALHLSHLYATHWTFTATHVPDVAESDFTTFIWTFQKPDPRFFRVDEVNPWIARFMDSEQKVQALMVQRGCGGVVDGKVAVAVLVRPPWLLSLKDMENFMNCSKLPSFDPAVPPSRMRRAHALWYAVKHVCQTLDTDYFILTTYEGWLFGKFENGTDEILGTTLQDSFEASSSSDIITGMPSRPNNPPAGKDTMVEGPRWSKCAVSAVFKYKARSPSIMESLTYWVARSMGLKYTNSIPLVYYLPRSDRIDLPLPTNRDATSYQPLLSLLTTAHPGIPFADIISTLPRPKLASGLNIPLTMFEERLLRDDRRYIGDLKRCGIHWLSPRAVFMQFQVWLRGYYEAAAVEMYPDLVSEELRERVGKIGDYGMSTMCPTGSGGEDGVAEVA